MTLEEALKQATIAVPDAGRLFFDLGRNASYDAAKAGDIPTIKVGGLLRVPVAKLCETLGIDRMRINQPTPQKKGPASVGALPDHGSTHPLKGMDMNVKKDSTASAGATIPPTAEDYSEAFYALEGDIIRLARHAKLAEFLLGTLCDRLEKEALKPGHEDLLELAYGAINDVRIECDSLDAAYLAKFNDLVSRENVALGVRP